MHDLSLDVDIVLYTSEELIDPATPPVTHGYRKDTFTFRGDSLVWRRFLTGRLMVVALIGAARVGKRFFMRAESRGQRTRPEGIVGWRGGGPSRVRDAPAVLSGIFLCDFVPPEMLPEYNLSAAEAEDKD